MRNLLPFVLGLSLISNTFALATNPTCQDIEEKLYDIHEHQSRFKIEGMGTVGELVEAIESLERSKGFLHAYHEFLIKAGIEKNSVKDFVQVHFQGVQEPFKHPLVTKNLAFLSASCGDLSSNESISKCDKALVDYKDNKSIDKLDHRLNERVENLKSALDETYNSADFKNMSKVAQFYASKKLELCPKDVEVVCKDIPGEENLEKLAVNSMDAIQKYSLAMSKQSEVDVEKSCRKLLKNNLNLKACEGVVCSKEKEMILGRCLEKCPNLYYRDQQNKCVPDEKAQQARNERKENSQKAWGKTGRTAATIVVASGAIAGTAWLVSKIFEGKMDRSINNNTYSGDTYNNYTFPTSGNTNGHYSPPKTYYGGSTSTYSFGQNYGQAVETNNYPYSPYSPYSMFQGQSFGLGVGVGGWDPYSRTPSYNYGYTPYQFGP